MDGGQRLLQIVLQLKDEASQKLSQLSQNLNADSVKKGANIIAVGFEAMGVAAIAGGVASVAMASQFQEAMTTLVTGAGEANKNIDMISQGILDMSSKVGQTPMALANGIYMIESAGYHGAAALQILQAAAQGATVGGADLATTTDAVTTVMKDYGTAAGGATGATNFLIGVVKQGKTHMQDLSQSLAQILPIAGSLNIPLDQIGGAMAAMTARGIPAANAATNLRFTISALAKPTSASAKLMEEFGMTSTQVGTVLTKQGLLPALQLLQDQVEKKFPQGSAQYVAAMSGMLGGTRGLQAGLSLTGKNMQDFIESSKTVASQMDSSKGSVMGWNQAQGDFNVQWKNFLDKLQVVSIELGDKLLPALTKFVSFLTNDLIPAIENTVKFFEQHKVALAALAGVATALLIPALIAIGIQLGVVAVSGTGVALSFTLAMPAVLAFAVATIAAFWPVMLVAAAVAVAAVLIVTHWKQITSTAQTLGKDIGNIFNSIKTTVENVAKAIGNAIQNGITIAKGILQALVAYIAGQFLPYFDVIKFAMTFIWDLFVLAWAAIKDVLQIFGNWFNATFGKQIQSVLDSIKTGLTNAWNFWQSIWKAISSFLSSIWNDIYSTVSGVVTDIFNWISTQFDNINKAVNDKMIQLSTFWGTIWKNIKQTVVTIAGDIWNVVKGLINDIIGGINKMINGFNSIGGKVAGFIKLPDIPMLAAGTNYFQGGMAMVGEQGPELVNLPTGSQVIPNNHINNYSNTGGSVNLGPIYVSNESDIDSMVRKLDFYARTSGRYSW